jgi:hypothetical protein
MIFLWITLLSCYFVEEVLAVDYIDKRIENVQMTIHCSNQKEVINVSFYNPTGTYVNLTETVNGKGVLRRKAFVAIEKRSYKEHYTDWVIPDRPTVSNFYRSNSASNIFLPPYSKRNINFKYDDLFQFNTHYEYVIYLTFGVYLKINNSTNYEILTSNSLEVHHDQCTDQEEIKRDIPYN